ncbi:MAG: peptide chain release factor 1 [Rhodospirillaceae bacterium]|nr:peptide chain release factor 1 [Rhodospirillaceae bacterium]
MNLDENLNRILSRYDELQALMIQSGGGGQSFGSLSKEFSDLGPLVEQIKKLQATRKELADTEALINDSGADAEMRALAEDELRRLKAEAKQQEEDVKVALIPKDEADAKNAILEVRAGTGGEEAALFAADLFRMYERYANRKGWSFEIMDINETGLGGFKEAVANITGKNVFARLKFESGVHRVQRVPDTEASGRVHTSAATVAVLPEVEEVEIDIKTDDLRIDTYRAQGAGGQHVNRTESAVRITHLPTGVVTQCQDEKSQHKNKARAMKLMRAKLYDAQRQKLDSERAADRKSQVGSGDRSERIRTYNFPQGRVTDHRINLTLYKIQDVLDGIAVDEFVDALTAEDQAARMAAMA